MGFKKVQMALFCLVTASLALAEARTMSFNGDRARELFIALGGDVTATNQSSSSQINQRYNLSCLQYPRTPISCKSLVKFGNSVLDAYEYHPEDVVSALKNLGVKYVERREEGILSLQVASVICVKRFAGQPGKDVPEYTCNISKVN